MEFGHLSPQHVGSLGREGVMIAGQPGLHRRSLSRKREGGKQGGRGGETEVRKQSCREAV